MRKISLTVLCLMAIVLVGCQTGPVIPGAVINDEGAVVFSAEGTSVIQEPGNPISEAKAELAAVTIAKANLLALIKGEVLTSKVRVADLEFLSEEASSAVRGLLARATVTCKPGDKMLEGQAVVATATLVLDPEILDQLDELAY